MHPLLILALAPALALPGLGDAPSLDDTITVEDPLSGDVSSNVTAQAGNSDLQLSLQPDDLGLYMQTALPGPGFSLPLEDTPGEDLARIEVGDQEPEEQAWGAPVLANMPEPADAAVPAGLTVLGAVAYAAVRWRFLGPWFLMPLYSRLSRSDLLENETRALLMDVITDQPGLSLQELAQASEAGWGTTVYHLQRLEQAGFIKSQKQGHHRRFYRSGEVAQDEVEALGMLRNDTPRQIAQYVVESPGCNQKAICEALDISPSLAHKYLKRLEEQELVTSQREWRSKHYTPDARLASLVDQVAA